MAADDLLGKLFDVQAKQHKPKTVPHGRPRHDIDDADDEPSGLTSEAPHEPPPEPPKEVPAHLRKYLVAEKPGRLQHATDDGFLGCDWAGLARMAAARRAAGRPLDDLDDEALRRAALNPALLTPMTGVWPPPPSTGT